MAIRFRCAHCDQLMSIASRMAGQTVNCSACDQETVVPFDDQQSGFAKPSAPLSGAASAENEASEAPGRDAYATDDPPAEQEDSAGEENRVVRDVEDSHKSALASATEFRSEMATEDEDDDDEGFQIRSAQATFEEMDLTPMVDVTFLLLIFFMLTASFSLQKTIEVPPPDPEQEGATQSIQTLDDLLDDSIKVEVDANNLILVDDEPVNNPADLANVLREKSRATRKRELILIADARALHETVVAVYDAANEAGIQRFRQAATSSGEFD